MSAAVLVTLGLLLAATPVARATEGCGHEDPEWLDVVALGSGESWTCTGTLVAPEWILTARHCVPVKAARVGADSATGCATRQVTRVVFHEDPLLDVALLRVDRPFPAELVHHRPFADAGDGPVKALGYGRFEENGRIVRGRRHPIDYRDPPLRCLTPRPKVFGCQPNLELVQLGEDGKDTCSGDSGGPLLQRAGDKWALVGITSRSIDGVRRICGAGGVYVRASLLHDWVTAVTGEG